MFQLIPLALLPMAAALIFGLGIALGARRDNMVILGLAIATSVAGLVPMLIDRMRPLEKRNLILTFICLAFIIGFVLPVYTHYYLNDGQMPGIAMLVGIGPADIINAQLAALLGLISLIIGFTLPVGSLAASILPQPRQDWSASVSIAVAMVMIPLGLAVTLAGQFRLIPGWMGTGIMNGISSAYLAGIALLAITYFRYKSRVALLLGIILVPPMMALAFFTGSKTLMLYPVMMIAFSHIVLTRRIRAFWVVGGLAVIILLYPIAVFFRQVVSMNNTLSAVEVLTNPTRTFGLLSAFTSQADLTDYLAVGLENTGRRFDAVGITAVIVRDTPDRVPFQGGWSIGYVFASYIPRVLWPDKPETTVLGQWITSNYGPGPHITSHTAPSWVGEFYLNFGFPGIALGCMSLGILFRMLQNFLLRGNPTVPKVLAGVIIVSLTAQSLEKSLVITVNTLLLHVIPVVAAYFAVAALALGRQRPSALTTPANSSPDLRSDPTS